MIDDLFFNLLNELAKTDKMRSSIMLFISFKLQAH